MKKTRKCSEGVLDDERILACLDIGAGQTIVDAGCGSGYMALKFLQLPAFNRTFQILLSNIIRELLDGVPQHSSRHTLIVFI